MSSNIDATQQGGGVVGGVGWMLTFLARCTNIDATQQGGGVVGGVGGILTFLARCTNIDATQQGGGWGGWDLNVPCTLHQHRPKNKENKSCAVGLQRRHKKADKI